METFGETKADFDEEDEEDEEEEEEMPEEVQQVIPEAEETSNPVSTYSFHYVNRSLQHARILTAVKLTIFGCKILFSAQNRDCWYFLELPQVSTIYEQKQGT